MKTYSIEKASKKDLWLLGYLTVVHKDTSAVAEICRIIEKLPRSHVPDKNMLSLMYCLYVLKDKESIPTLNKIVSHPNYEACVIAALTLAKMKVKSSLPLIEKRYKKDLYPIIYEASISMSEGMDGVLEFEGGFFRMLESTVLYTEEGSPLARSIRMLGGKVEEE